MSLFFKKITFAIENWVASKAWPHPHNQILIRAVTQKISLAKKNWRQWKEINNFDRITWAEHKLFTQLAHRMKFIDPTSPLRPRIEGLAKSHWTRSQLILHASQHALDQLLQQKIDVMVLKGAAHQALIKESSGPLTGGDLDILVRRSHFEKAIQVLYQHRWHSFEDSMEAACQRWRYGSGINLKLGMYGNIDIHHQPFKGQRLDDDALDMLWSRAKMTNFQNKLIYAPSLEDMVVIQSVHAAQSKKDANAHWVMSFILWITHPKIKPQHINSHALTMNVVPEVISTLLFIQTLSSHKNIRVTLNLLRKEQVTWRAWCYFYLRGLRSSRFIKYLLHQLLPSNLRMERIQDVIPKLHPHLFLKNRSHSLPTNETYHLFKSTHVIDIGSTLGHTKKIMIGLTLVPEIIGKYRFDLVDEYKRVSRLSIKVKQNSKKEKNYFFFYPIKNVGARLRIISFTHSGSLAAAKLQVPLLFKIHSVTF